MTAPTGAQYVAVVDDDQSVRRALGRLLTTMSYQVRTFGSAEEFIKTLPADVPACVVLDVHLPAMNGLTLQRRLQWEGHRAGVVFITADHELAASELMRATGAPCLRKPLDREALAGAIKRVMEGGPGTGNRTVT